MIKFVTTLTNKIGGKKDYNELFILNMFNIFRALFFTHVKNNARKIKRKIFCLYIKIF